MPMTAVLLPSLLFLSYAVELMPVVIVAVVVSYVVALLDRALRPLTRVGRHPTAGPPGSRPGVPGATDTPSAKHMTPG